MRPHPQKKVFWLLRTTIKPSLLRYAGMWVVVVAEIYSSLEPYIRPWGIYLFAPCLCGYGCDWLYIKTCLFVRMLVRIMSIKSPLVSEPLDPKSKRHSQRLNYCSVRRVSFCIF